MGYIAGEGVEIVGASTSDDTIIYLIDSPEHPFELDSLKDTLSSRIVRVPVCAWGESLTPWEAPALYRGEQDFAGHADLTLKELLCDLVPRVEGELKAGAPRRGLVGYSLGGLFALFALLECDAFHAVGCLSGSVWYEGWLDYLKAFEADLTGRFCYLSVGTKEKRAARPILKCVETRMAECAEALQDKGAQVIFALGPGSHLQHIPERLRAGLGAVDAFLTTP